MGKPVAGRVVIKINGNAYTTTGKCEIEPWNIEAKSVQNADGTSSQTLETSASKLSNLTFRATPENGITTELLREMINGFDLTYVDLDAGTTYYFNDAFYEGKPKFSSENAEISGLDVVSNNVVMGA